MYYQFLVEDMSGAELIKQIMEKVQNEYDEITYNCKPFHGLGGLKKTGSAKDIKTGHLLDDLVKYLKGFQKSLTGIPAVIIVVVDNDTRDTEAFYKQLKDLAEQNMIFIDHVFCIAVEEMEAWLLGDENAILSAYPTAKKQHIHNYKQDSICGTWEVLADAVYKGGHTKLKKQSSYYGEIGKLKCEWAKNIGQYMDIHNNASPSFNYFIDAVLSRAGTARGAI